MTFREDESRARADNSAENLNIIRHMSYNMLKNDTGTKASLNTKRHMCSWDDKYLIKILSMANVIGK